MSLSTSLDWSRSMRREWSWYALDPRTWQVTRPLETVLSAKVTWDADTDTKVSGTLEMDGDWSGEFWVRGYLDAEQGGVRERVPVATMLCQTPRRTLGAAFGTLHVDAYGPLRELADERVGFGWSATAGTPAIAAAASLARQLSRAPVDGHADTSVLGMPWVSGESDTALDAVRALAGVAAHEVTSDPYGRTVMQPWLRRSAMSPVAVVDDSMARGVIVGEVSDSTDWYEVPNVVEVVRSDDNRVVVGVATNDDPASDLSTVRRGRRVVRREVNPDGLPAGCTQLTADLFALRLLDELSHATRELSYERGFDPRIGVGDCVRVELARHGVSATGVVVRQDVSCDTGALVSEVVRVRGDGVALWAL